jgi:hypothetical protein
MYFSPIEFTEDEIDEQEGGVKSENVDWVGSIYLQVEKCKNVVATGSKKCSDRTANDSSIVKIWEQDKKVAGSTPLAVRYLLDHPHFRYGPLTCWVLRMYTRMLNLRLTTRMNHSII